MKVWGSTQTLTQEHLIFPNVNHLIEKHSQHWCKVKLIRSSVKISKVTNTGVGQSLSDQSFGSRRCPSSLGWQLGGPPSPGLQKKLGNWKLLPWWPGIQAHFVSFCAWWAQILVEADQIRNITARIRNITARILKPKNRPQGARGWGFKFYFFPIIFIIFF